MNLKKFFYQDYYSLTANVPVRTNGQDRLESRTFNLDKSSEPDAWKAIKTYNEPLLKIANSKLTEYTHRAEPMEILGLKQYFGTNLQTIKLYTTYPGLFTGSGYNHETGNTGELSLGFFFDHTTGLPILPGSSVKGVLRSVFPHFAKSEGDPLKPKSEKSALQKGKAKFIASLFNIVNKNGETDFETIHQIELAIFEGVDLKATFKKRKEAAARQQADPDSIVSYLSPSKRDIFLDAFISKGGKRDEILGIDSITPHGDNPLANPTPLPFLKIIPEVEFTFQFLLKASVFEDESKSISVENKQLAFQQILTGFGAGAKTNVGYGQFKLKGQTGTIDTLEEPKAKPIESQIFEKKPKMGDPLQAKVTEQGKVEIRTKTETFVVKLTGNCPAAGTIVHVRINGLDKSGKINQVSYQGEVR